MVGIVILFMTDFFLMLKSRCELFSSNLGKLLELAEKEKGTYTSGTTTA